MTAPLDTLWFTRCPVPTATGLAYKLGWLDEEFAADGIKVATLQDNREFGRHHYDHELPSLIREGGNLLAIAARAQGAPTRLIGLTWIEEAQVILVRPGSGIRRSEHLKGKRLALPAWIDAPEKSHVRGSSIARGMSLHGYKGALNTVGLSLDDVTLVEVGNGGREIGNAAPTREGMEALWSGLPDLVAGHVDAAYVKGASAIDAAARLGLEIGIDLDLIEDPRYRVNNGTPRPITVHTDLLRDHFDLVVRFIARTLDAADWAAENAAKVREILQQETRGGSAGVERAYSDQAIASLHPSLAEDRLTLFDRQREFMFVHGLLDRDLDIREWADHSVLDAARAYRRTPALSAA